MAQLNALFEPGGRSALAIAVQPLTFLTTRPSKPATKSLIFPLSLVPPFFTVAVIAVLCELLSTEIFEGSSVVSFTPAGASSTGFPPLPLAGPWSSAVAVHAKIITAEKDAVSSDPVMAVM